MPVTTLRLNVPPAQTLHPLRGFGTQFNTNLFTSAGQDPDLTAVQLDEFRKRSRT